ncbi:MAG: hypothetical protein PHU06_06225 [Gallionella sp.]|nr:hypothetical protein [Gallionella sp.]MDD4958438.1 hypothetical protein [Gallionella sp.]
MPRCPRRVWDEPGWVPGDSRRAECLASVQKRGRDRHVLRDDLSMPDLHQAASEHAVPYHRL